MANDLVPTTIALPRAPRNIGGVLQWARDIMGQLTVFLSRVVRSLNGAATQTGTWTPGISGDTGVGTKSYGARTGRYLLRGQEVTIWGAVTVNSWSVAPTGNLRVHGLPFRSENSSEDNVVEGLLEAGVTLSASYTQVYGIIENNSQTIRFREWGSGQTTQYIQCSAATPAVTIWVHGHYMKKHDEPASAAPD